MRKTTLSLLFTALSLAASPLDDAFAHHKAGDCDAALKGFETHFMDSTDPIRLNRAWAECALKTGDTEGALSAFERVMLFAPDDVDTRLALVSLYRELKMEKEADEMMGSIGGYALNARQKERYAALRSRSAPLPFTGYVKVLGGYDSNVNASASADLLYDYFNDLETEASPDRGPVDAAYSQLNARINYRYDVAGGFYLQAMADGLNKHYMGEDYYDITMVTLRGTVGYANRSFSLNLPVEYRRIHHLDRDLFEQSGIRPNLTVSVLPTLLFSANAEYAERSYLQKSDRIRDDRFAGGSVGLFYTPDNQVVFLQASSRQHFKEFAEAMPFTDKVVASLLAGMKYSFDDTATLQLLARYNRTHFIEAADLSGGELRQDNMFITRMELEVPIDENFAAVGEITHMASSSNFRPASYIRYNAAIGVNYTF